MTRQIKVISCSALEHLIQQLSGLQIGLEVLEVGLHLQPRRLRAELMRRIKEIEEEGSFILLGYGLCGRALEGVVSKKSTLVLPMVDDCIGMLLGSRKKYRQIMKDNPGTYFLIPDWLNTELNIFEQMEKETTHLPRERRKQILKSALKHYKRLALISEDEPDPGDRTRCMELASEYNLEFIPMKRDLYLIKKLLHGPWEEPDFLVVPPGTPIPLF